MLDICRCAFKSEVYLTCIDFWKFHEDLKARLEVIRLSSWPEKVKFSVKIHFFTFLTTWKICFGIYSNSKFIFGSDQIPPKPYFHLTFRSFKVSNHILSSNSAEKILKMAIKSELVGLCSQNFWNFLFSMRLSNGEYFNDFKIFDLTSIWWIWLEWPCFQFTIQYVLLFISTWCQVSRLTFRYFTRILDERLLSTLESLLLNQATCGQHKQRKLFTNVCSTNNVHQLKSQLCLFHLNCSRLSIS